MNLKFGTVAFLLLILTCALSADANKNSRVVLPASKVASIEKKKPAIKLYPNPCTTGTIQVVSNTPGQLNFYIFDLEGTLLHQAVIQQKQKHIITNLKKGVYTYDAFYNDEGVEHGKLIVK